LDHIESEGILVTGGAGFIGSHLFDRLLQRGAKVWRVDNLRLGRRRNIAHLEVLSDFHFIEFDVLDRATLNALFGDARFDAVFHLAANSDLAAGVENVRLDLKLNQLTTVAVLEAMKAHNVERLFFASSSAIFGETDALLHEDFAPLRPISFYGASKLAAEAYVSVFVHTFGGRAAILHFPNVTGERATHGIIFDFMRQLRADRGTLEVLGDGKQSKPYLYVQDLIDGMHARVREPLSAMQSLEFRFHWAGARIVFA
jgi:UDP-glucose 4-epimerase